jgi:hypothetical protein
MNSKKKTQKNSFSFLIILIVGGEQERRMTHPILLIFQPTTFFFFSKIRLRLNEKKKSLFLFQQTTHCFLFSDRQYGRTIADQISGTSTSKK